ncbi:MAG: hypothetical protein ACOCSN_05460, partial [Halanaeroarchaeum sp.]
ARSAAKSIKRAIRSKLDFRLKSRGAKIAGSLADGLRSKLGAVRDAAGDLGDAIDKRMPESDAKEGPLSNISEYGPAFAETLAKGLEGSTRPVEKAATTLAGAADGGLAPPKRSGSGGGSGDRYVTYDISVDARDASTGEEIGQGIYDALSSEGFRD